MAKTGHKNRKFRLILGITSRISINCITFAPQLTTKVSEIPEMQDAYEAGKKEAEEGNEESLDNSEKTEEKEPETKKESKREEEDSLFDLIDSMYQDSEEE